MAAQIPGISRTVQPSVFLRGSGGTSATSTNKAMSAILDMAVRLEKGLRATTFAHQAFKDIKAGTWTQAQNKMGEAMLVASEVLKERDNKIPPITNPVSPDVLA